MSAYTSRSERRRSINFSAVVVDVYPDRTCEYNIEYGKEEASSGKYRADIYISIRTTCWAKIRLYFDYMRGGEYQTCIYRSFEPFDYENDGAILSRINLEGTIPKGFIEDYKSTNGDTPLDDKRIAYSEEVHDAEVETIETAVQEIDRKLGDEDG